MRSNQNALIHRHSLLFFFFVFYFILISLFIFKLIYFLLFAYTPLRAGGSGVSVFGGPSFDPQAQIKKLNSKSRKTQRFLILITFFQIFRHGIRNRDRAAFRSIDRDPALVIRISDHANLLTAVCAKAIVRAYLCAAVKTKISCHTNLLD